MKNFNVLASLTRAFYKTSFTFKKHRPEIYMIGGAIGVVGAAVGACRATLKVHDVTDEHKKTVAKIHKTAEVGHTKDGVEYTAKDHKRELTAAYAQTGLKFAKLYGPSVVLGATSLGFMFASHGIMRQRNTALAAAYFAADKAFKEYRGNVIERFGKDLDKELRYNVKTKEIEETVIDEKGKEKKVKKKVQVSERETPSDFSRCFDESCVGWTKDPERNKAFLHMQERWANDRLQRQGHLFLNEVYDMLGFDRTEAGQHVGWLYRPNDPEWKGDNYVDFNIYDITKEANRKFVNGHERSIWLDFNIDGPIYHLI